jgi:hypothetical protein
MTCDSKINLLVFGLTRPGLNPHSTALETSTQTIIPPMQFCFIASWYVVIDKLSQIFFVLEN